MTKVFLLYLHLVLGAIWKGKTAKSRIAGSHLCAYKSLHLDEELIIQNMGKGFHIENFLFSQMWAENLTWKVRGG